MKYVIIKDNYVINAIVWDGETPYEYPFEHDLMLLDELQSVSIGDYYDQTDGTFWRPVPTHVPQNNEGNP